MSLEASRPSQGKFPNRLTNRGSWLPPPPQEGIRTQGIRPTQACRLTDRHVQEKRGRGEGLLGLAGRMGEEGAGDLLMLLMGYYSG